MKIVNNFTRLKIKISIKGRKVLHHFTCLRHYSKMVLFCHDEKDDFDIIPQSLFYALNQGDDIS